VFENYFPDQHRGERAGFGGGKSPFNNASAVEVDDDIEVIVAADGGEQFRDVPSPDLVASHEVVESLPGDASRFDDVRELPCFAPVFNTSFAPSKSKCLR